MNKIKDNETIRANNISNIKKILDKIELKTQKINENLKKESNLRISKTPFSMEAEKGILSGLIIDQNLNRNFDLLNIEMEDFYNKKNAIIFEAIKNIQSNGEPITTTIIVNELARIGKLEEAGGSVAIAELERLLSTSAHLEAYCKIVKNKSTLRKLTKIATLIIQSTTNENKKTNEIIDEAEKAILSIRDNVSQNEAVPIRSLFDKVVFKIEAMNSNKNGVTGLPSGFLDLDKLTGGLHPGELIIIAGRPSMGKTAFALNIAAHVSKLRIPVLFFSLEMAAEQLVQRLICSEAEIDLAEMRKGNIPGTEFAGIISTLGFLESLPIFVDENPTLNISEMRSKSRQMAHKHGVKLIIVDYLQLMDSSRNYDNKATEVGDISKGLKSIARELKIPVISLSQLNRGVESRIDKRPMMSDLRESGTIEQDADLVILLYREDYYKKTETLNNGLSEVIVSKNRNGPTGYVKLKFLSNITSFHNINNYNQL